MFKRYIIFYFSFFNKDSNTSANLHIYEINNIVYFKPFSLRERSPGTGPRKARKLVSFQEKKRVICMFGLCAFFFKLNWYKNITNTLSIFFMLRMNVPYRMYCVCSNNSWWEYFFSLPLFGWPVRPCPKEACSTTNLTNTGRHSSRCTIKSMYESFDYRYVYVKKKHM